MSIHHTATRNVVGIRAPEAAAAAAISYRQLDYWARTGLVVPSIHTAAGSGTARLYDEADVVLLYIVRALLDGGISLRRIRQSCLADLDEDDFAERIYRDRPDAYLVVDDVGSRVVDKAVDLAALDRGSTFALLVDLDRVRNIVDARLGRLDETAA